MSAGRPIDSNQFSFKSFVQLWGTIPSSVKEVFKHYLIQKPYSKFVGDKLISQLQSQTVSTDLKIFITALCQDIKNGGIELKKIIEKQTEVLSGQAESLFIEDLDNQSPVSKEANRPDYSFMYTMRSGPLISKDERQAIASFFNQKEIDIATENKVEKEASLKIASHYTELGSTNIEEKAYLLAEQNFRKAIELYGKEDFSYGACVARGNLGYVLLEMGRYSEALPFYREVEARLAHLSREERLQDQWEELSKTIKTNILRLASHYTELGSSNIGEREYHLAEQNLRTAIELYGKEDPSYGACVARSNLGHVLLAMGRFAEGLLFYKEAEARLKSLSPEEHTQENWMDLSILVQNEILSIANHYAALARKNTEEKAYPLAEQNFRKAIELYDRDSYRAFEAKMNFGTLLIELKRQDEILPFDKEVEERLADLSTEELEHEGWSKLAAYKGLRDIETIESEYSKLLKVSMKEGEGSQQAPDVALQPAVQEIHAFASKLKTPPHHNSKLILIGYILLKQSEHKESNTPHLWKKESEFSQLTSQLFKILNVDQSLLVKAKASYVSYQSSPTPLAEEQADFNFLTHLDESNKPSPKV